uniref:Uncharacterized protein n=1 Tax=uncultured marine thaumarchaeote KM3_52_B01 TaxID=1456176 RepID=A0A075H8Q4_9ARCH|nr:hypothetical protein [uncultured marine thaumarchaeote KM3_52_B01]
MSIFKGHRIQGIILRMPVGAAGNLRIYGDLHGVFPHAIVHGGHEDDHEKRGCGNKDIEPSAQPGAKKIFQSDLKQHG